MKKILTPVLLFAVLSAGAQTDTTEVPTDSVIVQMIALPDLTAIGAPDGKLVSKEIGSSGGTIISEDGKVELIFPEGALTTTTTISIQPTTNLVPNGNGKAYQFEPSGTRFLKPVSLIFHYTLKEAEACPPELMFLAIQDSKGKWEYMDYEDWDSTAKSLKGFITHFSQVVNGNLAELIPGEETIKVKSSKTFSLNIVTIPADATTPDVDEGEDYLPPLPAIAPLGNYKATWLVNETVGGTAKFGKIVPGENKSQATYTAPALLPAEYAVKVKLKVSLYITNKEKTTKAGKRTGKMIK